MAKAKNWLSSTVCPLQQVVMPIKCQKLLKEEIQRKILRKLQKKICHGFPIKFREINIVDKAHAFTEENKLPEVWLYSLPQ